MNNPIIIRDKGGPNERRVLASEIKVAHWTESALKTMPAVWRKEIVEMENLCMDLLRHIREVSSNE